MKTAYNSIEIRRPGWNGPVVETLAVNEGSLGDWGVLVTTTHNGRDVVQKSEMFGSAADARTYVKQVADYYRNLARSGYGYEVVVTG